MNLFFLLLFSLVGMAQAGGPQSARVVVPIADVWSRPLAPGEKPSDDLRETQVLKGESVLIHESSGPWVRIEAIEQPEFTHHNRWEGYPGWVLRSNLESGWGSDLSMNSYPYGFDDKVLKAAQSFLGDAYLWGGLSSGGVDCSGLVHYSYRKSGLKIPRDAHEQWMKAKPIKRANLKPADLIFSAKADKPKTITHVALYVGNGQIIEAPQTGIVVRKLSFKEKYGKDLGQVESGDHVGDKVIYFGTFLH